MSSMSSMSSMNSGQQKTSSQYFHNRGTDRILRDLGETPNPTRAEVERAKAQARANVARLSARLAASKIN